MIWKDWKIDQQLSKHGKFKFIPPPWISCIMSERKRVKGCDALGDISSDTPEIIVVSGLALVCVPAAQTRNVYPPKPKSSTGFFSFFHCSLDGYFIT